MLPKKNRVDRKTLEKVLKEGKFINSLVLIFRFMLTNKSVAPRLSFVAPKKLAKLAIKRNFLRRNGYRALDRNLKNFPPGIVGVFLFKKYEDSVSILENEIKTILNKIH